jgi:hypothetical protein
MQTVKVRIPIIVTADGKWAAASSHKEDKPDWGWLDELCDDINPTVMPMRYFIVAELPVPKTEMVFGEVVRETTK